MIAKRSKLIEPRFAAGRHQTFDQQAEMVPAVLAERARRALWADCERRPISHDLPPAAPAVMQPRHDAVPAKALGAGLRTWRPE